MWKRVSGCMWCTTLHLINETNLHFEAPFTNCTSIMENMFILENIWRDITIIIEVTEWNIGKLKIKGIVFINKSLSINNTEALHRVQCLI